MVVSLLLLFAPLCGAVVYHDIQSFYQADEDDSVTLEWAFPSMANIPFTSLHIFCHLTDKKASALFDLRGGIEVPEGERFVGRVHCEKEALREGRIRLHVSRLRTDDSGLYLCGVLTKNGIEFNKCYLNVTAVRRPEPLTWEPGVKGTVNRYCGCGLTALLLYWFFLCTLFFM